MAYPLNVKTRLVSFGGAATVEAGIPLHIRISTESSRSLIWVEDGYRLESLAALYMSATDGQEIVFEVPTTDQNGWLDAATRQAIIVEPGEASHLYTTKLEIFTEDHELIRTYGIGPYAVPEGPGTLDADLLNPNYDPIEGTLTVYIPGPEGGLSEAGQQAAANAVQAAIDAEGYRDEAEGYRDEAEVFSATTVELQDAAVAALVDDPDSASGRSVRTLTMAGGYGAQVFSVADFGAVDGGANSTTAIRAAANAAAGQTLLFPPGLWITDPVSVDSGTTVIVLGTVRLRGQDVSGLPTSHGVLYSYGTAESPVSNIRILGQRVGVIDGNARGMSNLSARTFDMEGINFKYGLNCEIDGLTIVDTLESGIDLDNSDGCRVTNNTVREAYGYGIHISSGSEENFIGWNDVSDSGFGGERGGIDQYEGASGVSTKNMYVGNNVRNCYRNYNIRGTLALFDTSNASQGGSIPDAITADQRTMASTPALLIPRVPLMAGQPTGGSVVDSEARAAISALRAQLLSSGVVTGTAPPANRDMWDRFDRVTVAGLGESDSGATWDGVEWQANGAEATQISYDGLTHRASMLNSGPGDRTLRATFRTGLERAFIGFQFRYADGANYLVCNVRKTVGTNGVYLSKSEGGGTPITLAHFPDPVILADTDYDLQVALMGDLIVVHLDGKLLGSYTLTPAESTKYASRPGAGIASFQGVSWDDGTSVVKSFDIIFV